MEQPGAKPNRRVLCVDDDHNVLEGLQRTLFERFDVVTAGSGEEGLRLLSSEAPYAVVVSDMRMPGMDGAALLSEAGKLSPGTVQVLLTGETDLSAAASAVNRGHVFRILKKPTPSAVLLESLEAAVQHFDHAQRERDLLERTLNGAVRLLTDVLSLAAPLAFSRAGTIKRYMAHLARGLEVENQWKLELAGMLSQIGCIALPPDVLSKMYESHALDAREQEMVAGHTETAHRLLSAIPRLEEVGQIIRLSGGHDGTGGESPEVLLGAETLKLAQEVDGLVLQGCSPGEAVGRLRKRGGYRAELLSALGGLRARCGEPVMRILEVAELRPSMVLEEDILAKNGNVLVTSGGTLTPPLIERLRNFSTGIGVREPIRVRIPQSGSEEAETETTVGQSRGSPQPVDAGPDLSEA